MKTSKQKYDEFFVRLTRRVNVILKPMDNNTKKKEYNISSNIIQTKPHLVLGMVPLMNRVGAVVPDAKVKIAVAKDLLCWLVKTRPDVVQHLLQEN